MKELIQKAREWALQEIEKNGSPSIIHFDLSNNKGQELAEKLDADKDLVMVGTILMDVKLGECIKEGKIPEHIERSAKATEEFLKDFDIDEETKKKIVNCAAAHHGTVDFICKEAEICANADCYRFIHPRGVLAYLKKLDKRLDNFENAVDQVKKKMDEKKGILTLNICKEELKPYYDAFEDLFNKAKLN